MLQIKRIYDDPNETDGTRILVDGLWPKGMTKERAALDIWAKKTAPSNDLRVWFSHKPERFKAFSIRYIKELTKNPATAELKVLVARNPVVTLLYATEDPQINHAVVLQNFLQQS